MKMFLIRLVWTSVLDLLIHFASLQSEKFHEVNPEKALIYTNLVKFLMELKVIDPTRIVNIVKEQQNAVRKPDIYQD